MKSTLSLAAFLALFSLTGLIPAFADQGANSVVVVNNTSYSIYELYASSSSAASWDASSNLLGSQGIAPGQQVTVNIPSSGWWDSGDACSYDLMAVLYGTQQYGYQYSVNVCGGASWTITN